MAAIGVLDIEAYVLQTANPTDRFIPAATSASGEITPPAENSEYKIWVRTDQLLLCWLLTTIGDQVISQVNHATS